MLDIRKLDAPFGAVIHDVDLVKAVSEWPLMRDIINALHTHRVIVMKGQVLTPQEYLSFGQQWGKPIVHVLTYSRPNVSPGGFAEIVTIGNVTDAARDEKLRLSAAFWHTDQSYEEVPASATMLYALKSPKTGGQTMLADMVAAYDALPDNIKERIDDLTAVHLYGSGEKNEGEYDATKILTDADRKRIAPVRHKLVIRHPFNGCKALYAVAGSAIAIEGMENNEAHDLLHDLKAHALQDRFRHDIYYDPGDVVVWDTLATLHSAVPIAFSKNEEDARLLWRISCCGAPTLLQ